MQRALEIHARSSYVPGSTIGVRSPDYRITRAKSGAVAPPGFTDMDEVIRAKRQQTGSGARAITIRGAREHNLKNVDVEILRDKLVVFTGLSGSGK